MLEEPNRGKNEGMGIFLLQHQKDGQYQDIDRQKTSLDSHVSFLT